MPLNVAKATEHYAAAGALVLTKKSLKEFDILSGSLTTWPSSVLKVLCWLTDLHRPIIPFIVFHVCLMLFFIRSNCLW